MEPLQHPGLRSLAGPPPAPAPGEGSEEALTHPPLRPLPCVGYPTLPQLLETLLEILQTLTGPEPGEVHMGVSSTARFCFSCKAPRLLHLGVPAPRWCPGHRQVCVWPSACRGHVADAQSVQRGGQGACVGKVLRGALLQWEGGRSSAVCASSLLA